MRVEFAGDRATVRLTPGRIARLFGARETVADLHVAEVVSGWRSLQGDPVRAPERWDDGSLRWGFIATGRAVRGSQHGELILRALGATERRTRTRRGRAADNRR